MKKSGKPAEANPSQLSQSKLAGHSKKTITASVAGADLQKLAYKLEAQNKELKQARADAEESYRQYTDLYDFAPVGYLTLAVDASIRRVNLAGANLIGVERRSLVNQRLGMFVSDASLPTFNAFLEKLSSDQGKKTCELEILNEGGTLWVRIEATCFEGGAESRAVLADITERRRMASLLQTRLQLSQFADSHSLDEVLQMTLDKAEALTGSQIGFAHFLEADQKTLVSQTWSTNTLKNMCAAEGTGSHYPVDQAGIWADCVFTRAPLIHNDYASLPASRRKGLPQGHAPVVRELVVPVLHNDLIVMIIGVGNKLTDYNVNDVETLSQLANSTWDIVQRKRTEELLKESEWRNRIVSELTTDYIFVVDVGSNGILKFRWASNNLFRITGRTMEEVTTSDLWGDIIHPDDRNRFFGFIAQILSTAGAGSLECRTFYKHGGERWICVFAHPQIGSEAGVTTIVGAIQDITERKRVEEKLAYQANLLANVNDAIIASDAEYRLTAWNSAAETLYGWKAEEVLGRNGLEIIQTQWSQEDAESMRRTIAETGRWRGEATQVRKDGIRIPVEISSLTLRDANGRIEGYISVNRDITERRQAEDELRRARESLMAMNLELETALAREKQLAHTDPLTGINNRRRLYELVEYEIKIAARYSQPFSVMMFDIDHFKMVNDTFGHEVGDHILQRVTQVACGELRSADGIGRYGGEEFVVVLPMTKAQQAYPLAERIRLAVAALCVPTENGDVSVTLSIGIVEMRHGPKNDSAEDMIRRADKAMYAAKQSGRNLTLIGDA